MPRKKIFFTSGVLHTRPQGQQQLYALGPFLFWSAISHHKHNVFMSFRGEDTSHGLAEDLYSALTNW